MTGALPAWKLREATKRQALPGQVFLLFGPDSSTVDSLSSDIIASVSAKEPTLIRIEGSACQENKGLIAQAMRQRELFSSGPQIIIIYQADAIPSASLKLIEPLIASFGGFVIARAGPIGASHIVRSWFTKHGFSVGCYPLSEKQVARLVGEQIKRMNRRLSVQAQRWIVSFIGQDTATIQNQLHKLELYCTDNREISFADAQACLLPYRQVPIESLIETILEADTAGALRSLKGIMNEPGMKTIMVLRVFLTCWQQILQIKTNQAQGTPILQAIDALKPVVFFRTRDVLLRQTNKCSSRDVAHFIDVTLSAETTLKRSRLDHRMILRQCVIDLCTTRAKKVPMMIRSISRAPH